MVVGAVLCGGRSSRFGSDKALANFGDATVGHHIIEALRNGGADPVVAIGGTAGHELGVPTVPDLRPNLGPLAGLATALLWAKTGSVIVVPCDLPLLRSDHVARLIEAAEDGRATVATVAGEPQVSLALWPAAAGRDLLAKLNSGARSYRSALEVVEWTGIELPAEAVTDTDTPAELRHLAKGHGNGL